MAGSDRRRRWTWRAILLLVALNALLWAPFALSAGHSRLAPAGAAEAGCQSLSPR